MGAFTGSLDLGYSAEVKPAETPSDETPKAPFEATVADGQSLVDLAEEIIAHFQKEKP